MNLFAAARAGMPLSPGQRAALKAFEAIAYAALVSFFGVIPAITNGFTAVNWGVILGALGMAFLVALSKYLKAHGDAPLGDVADLAAQKLADVAGIPNAAKTELEAAGLPDTPTVGDPSQPVGVVPAS